MGNETTGYQGSVGLEPVIENGGSKWRLIYNASTALTNGVPYALTMTVASGVPYYTVVAPVTNAVGTKIVIIDNSPLGLATIPATSWGYVLESGLSVEAVTSGSVTANDQLEVLTTAAAFVDQGTNGGAVIATNTAAIAVVEVSTNKWKVMLLPTTSVIAAT
jgi:hypothetical protein